MNEIVFALIILMSAAVTAGAHGIGETGASRFRFSSSEIPHGNLDTISYRSNTVRVNRKALIYTPPPHPDLPKKKNTRCCIYCMALAVDEKE